MNQNFVGENILLHVAQKNPWCNLLNIKKNISWGHKQKLNASTNASYGIPSITNNLKQFNQNLLNHKISLSHWF